MAVLRQFARMGWHRASFKVVTTCPEDVDAARQLYDDVEVPRRARWVMPEARTARDVSKRLAAMVEHALAAGMNVSSRTHVMLWGDERGR